MKNSEDRQPFKSTCGKCGARRVDQQIGLEETPEQWVASLVDVFREVRRVLRADGTLWLEIGDSYANQRGWSGLDNSPLQLNNQGSITRSGQLKVPPGYKPKDLIGAPWKLAQALRDPYYAGEIKNESDRVWLAATIDAEGCISGHRHTRKDNGEVRTGCHVTITNTNEAMLDEAQRIWPSCRTQHEPRRGSMGQRDCWRWVATGVDRNALLMRELYPHLIAKKRQAMLAYNLFELSRVSKRTGKTPEGAKAREQRDWIVAALSRLNQGQPVDVPKWIKEPETLFADGWYLRSDIVWARPNPMPESVTDRPTKSHSYVFLLAKQPRYYWDAEALRENVTDTPGRTNGAAPSGSTLRPEVHGAFLTDDGATDTRGWCDLGGTEAAVVLPVAGQTERFQVLQPIGLDVGIETTEGPLVVNLEGVGDTTTDAPLPVALSRSVALLGPVWASVVDAAASPSGAVLATSPGTEPSTAALLRAEVVGLKLAAVSAEYAAAVVTLDLEEGRATLLVWGTTRTTHLRNIVVSSGRNARSVWVIPTQPQKEAHFATFPEELARRCILAGTSERGCCPECGAPWIRQVELDDEYRDLLVKRERPEPLGHWLREHREAAGLSMKELCAAVGAYGAVNHGGAVSNWEADKNIPAAEQWQRLKQVLGFGDEKDDLVEAWHVYESGRVVQARRRNA